MFSPRFPSITTVVLVLLVTLTPSAAPMVSAQSDVTDVLRVQIHGVRSDRGQVLCSLFDRSGASAFPTDVRRALQRGVRARGRGRTRTCAFEAVRPGDYAVSVLHDEDSSGDMNTNVFGAPQEGWGVSNDAEPSTFSPPSYSDARFSFDAARSVRIRVRY